ncbi:MAG TPA: Nramp family divalent metal transporter [Longimicrobium sp.]|nr:Nramp family divalent metal transporter [Longimicrobium sp.]
MPPPLDQRTQPPRRGLANTLRHLGPGLVTGAADDDPSGVATYSAAGAQFGFGLLWTAPLILPLMAAIQYMCARIGMVSGMGLAAVLRQYYPRWVLWMSCGLLLVANTVNIGADLGAMAAVAQMLTGVPSAVFAPAFAALILALLVFASYRVMARVFKWLTLALFAYVGAAFLARPDWGEVLRSTVVPSLAWERGTVLTLVAILGTTISPYLFFWQADEEVEEEKALGRVRVADRRGATPRAMRAARFDVLAGMTISVVIFYFIVLTTGATLHAAGHTTIQTAEEAAQALRPIAGSAASLLFSLGIVGTGMLGVPVLAGSAALAVAEAEAWNAGMSEKPNRAARFYGVMALSLLAGMVMLGSGIPAIRMLFWAAVVNGLLAPPLIAVILVVCNDRRVMGEWRNGRVLNVLGGVAGIAMAAAAVTLVILS